MIKIEVEIGRKEREELKPFFFPKHTWAICNVLCPPITKSEDGNKEECKNSCCRTLISAL